MKQRLHSWMRRMGCALLALLAAGCEIPLVPKPQLARAQRGEQVVARLMEQLRVDWKALGQAKMEGGERQALITRYNRNLLRLVQHVRYDVLVRKQQLPCPFVLEYEGVQSIQRLSEVFDDIVPAQQVRLEELEERYVAPGLGVPMVGVIPATKLRQDFGIAAFRARGTVSTLTGILEFPGGKPVMRLISRREHENARVGRMRYQLAGDFSAAIEVYWRLTRVQKDKFLGLLRPQHVRNATGLVCMERYDAHKIPVVLVHGLASSAATFANLVNRLMREPEIRRNFQFWYYNYPTGLAWPVSAAGYRAALRRTREHFDPEHRNPNWERMVAVGHSMGGLITHYSQCIEPWKLLEAANDPQHGNQFSNFLSGRFVNRPLPVGQDENLRDVYYFEPIRAGRVVYMATPHRGAPIARNRFVLLFSNLMRLPQTLVEEIFSIATLQQDSVLTNPGKFAREFNSIRQLSRLAVRNVPTYTILGDRGYNDSPRSSDGIVPYWSSHLPWGAEDIVSSDHHVQDAEETADVFARILRGALHDRDVTHPGAREITREDAGGRPEK